MERLRTEQPKGLTCAGLRKWGMLFVMLGVFGRSILLNCYLGIAGMTNDQLLEAMSNGSEVMVIVTIALVFQFLETMAAPIFCLLLAEGCDHTSDMAMYMGRVLGVAAISELPYNFAMSGKLFDMGSRNPVFGMFLAMVVLYLYKQYSQKSFKNLLIKIAGTFAAVFWCRMLKVEGDIVAVILTCVFWAFRKKPNIRNLMGGTAAMFCSIFSIFYVLSPMGLMVLHFYNGEKGDENRLVSYLFYPAVLLVFGIAGALAF